ncbi:hypothetical protein F8M41_015092 [Gigaspora margarita]|uniref:Uncharacterized protein n=1 Tax=Gigaspora margarita TaxID=4874 RepID=A0A8H4AQU9_GIGMA|nr:hypothetical protein F8M41_015092 [Gigaspora margarita]
MKGIKGKLLASFNGASKEELMIHLKNYSGPWTILHYLIEEVCNDPFWPLELNQQQSSNNGSPSKLPAKLCKPSHILYSISDNISNEISPPEQKRKTINMKS